MGPTNHEDSKSRDESLLARFWRQLFGDMIGQVEQDARLYLASERSHAPDRKVIIILLTVAVALATQYYLWIPTALEIALKILSPFLPNEFSQEIAAAAQGCAETRIGRLFFWCLTCLVSYFVIPALVIRFVLKERIRDYGVKLKGAFASFPTYLAMLAFMVPLVITISVDRHFQQTYPFYPLLAGEALWPNFWRWEILYALQFFALEFLFRGFVLHGIKHRFGVYAIFVMMVPYCMIHFGKPIQETFAAIVAGILLGLMSLKTRSIWMGALLHVSVALTMDFSSLWRKGFFG